MSLLSSESRRIGLNPPRLRDMMPLYNKCIQLEDEPSRQQLVQFCSKDPYRAQSKKFRRIHT